MQGEKNSKSLTIYVNYAGLGDNLFYSHLPRIAKSSNGGGAYDKVFIQPYFEFRHDDYKRLIWEANPYVDGVLEPFYRESDFKAIKPNPPFNSPQSFPFFSSQKAIPFTLNKNLLDDIMLFNKLDDGKRFHEPELYYKPKFREEFHKVIFDPNFITNIGGISFESVLAFFKANEIKIDAVMQPKIQAKANSATQRRLFDDDLDIEFIQTPTLEDFCDLIYSAKALYCFVTGTATLAAALNKPINVLVGVQHPYVAPYCLHSKLHHYYLIESKQVLCHKRVKRFRFFGLKGQIKIKQKNFERILKCIKVLLPQKLGKKVLDYLDFAFKANPDKTLTPKELKEHCKTLASEIFTKNTHHQGKI